jgi:hypothetical protein
MPSSDSYIHALSGLAGLINLFSFKYDDAVTVLTGAGIESFKLTTHPFDDK